MLHADELDQALTEQIKLRNQGLSVESYFENLGVCPECLKAVADKWLDNNVLNLVKTAVEQGPESMVGVLGISSFACGFSLGHVVGSGIATS